MTQQVRNLSFTGVSERMRFLIHDRDSKFSGAFDEVFRSEGISVIHTPIRAPQANAYAERFVRTVRAECLDWLLILGRRHLESVLRVYTAHYNRERPHRGLALLTPETGNAIGLLPPKRSTAATDSADSSTSTTEPGREPNRDFETLHARHDNSSASWSATRTATDSATSAARRESSSAGGADRLTGRVRCRLSEL